MRDCQDFRDDAGAFLHQLVRTASVRVACSLIAIQLAPCFALAVDVTFNMTLVGQSNPFPPASASTWSYAEVWGEGNVAYLGSDRSGRGISMFNISDPANPQFIRNPLNPTGPLTLTTYAGSEMEDVEVYNGIGYFGSDVSTSSGTGVDVVNVANPASPVMLSRINGPNGGGHNKVHTLSVSNGYLYTVDNSNDAAADSVKIFNVTNPSNPQFVASVVIGVPAPVAAHEVVVLNDRMYVASKWNGSDTCCGWTHIYDVSNPSTPVLLKGFDSGPRTHTVWPTDNRNTIIVAQERFDGDVRIYDVSMINEASDPDTPVLLATLNDNSVGIDAYTPHHPFVKGNLLFLSWYEAGLLVFNITDPANPIRVGAFDTYTGGYNPAFGAEHGAWGVYPMLGLDRVLIGDRDRGLIIVDATSVLAPGDYDQNGIVDMRDYSAWRVNLGTTNRAADGNNNGIVDAADYVVWRNHLGETLPPGLGAGAGSSNDHWAVPEPILTMPLASAVFALFPNRRKRQR